MRHFRTVFFCFVLLAAMTFALPAQAAQQTQQAQQAQMMEMAQASAPASQAVKNVAELAQNGNPAMQSWLGMGGLQ